MKKAKHQKELSGIGIHYGKPNTGHYWIVSGPGMICNMCFLSGPSLREMTVEDWEFLGRDPVFPDKDDISVDYVLAPDDYEGKDRRLWWGRCWKLRPSDASTT